jgi:hypothetical protein
VPPNTSATGGYLAPTTTAPPSDQDFARQLSNLVAGVTGVPGNMVRPRWQAVPPPIPRSTDDWFAVGVTTVEPADRGTPYIRHVGRAYDPNTGDEVPYDGRSDLTQHELITVLASAYGPASGHNSSLLRDGLAIEQNWELAHSRGMTLVEIGPIRHVPEQVDEVWYDRRDVEIKIRREVDRTYSILNILSAQGTLHCDRLPSTAEPTEDWTTENVNG